MKSDSEIVLNKRQKEAIEHEKGPLLIIAGAGTGKTTVITEKIKYLVTQNKVKPEEILALTFTEKAAKEMETRVDSALSYGTFGLWISTFHSFCDRILRQESLNIGLSPNFKLLTEAEAYLLVKQNLWQFKLNYFRPSGNPYKFIEGLIQHFDRLKDEDIVVEDYLSFVQKHSSSSVQAGKENTEEETEKYQELANAYKVYEALKIKEDVMDFSDLITNVLKLFRKRKSVLNKYITQFKYILIDEFQDTNYAQYQLIKLLAPAISDPNLTVVGDDSQSIYKFRGAAISNILYFMKDYKKAKQIILTDCYRCSQTILDNAYTLIQHNNPNTLESTLGISKSLTAYNNFKGENIEVRHTDRVENEAEVTALYIQDYRNTHKKQYKDFAILIRANNHSEAFIRAFDRARIPYQFLGPGMLFRQPEIKNLIAYLKILYDFTDSVSLYRVLSMDIWNISARDLIAAINSAKRNNLSVFEQLEKIETLSILSDASKTEIAKFVKMVHNHQKLMHKETAGQILYFFLVESGLIKNIIKFKSQKEEKIALNVSKFFDKLKSFEATHENADVFAVVDYLDLAMGMGESPLAAETDWTENNAVNILTVHSAKGLEFPVVFLVNLVEGRFPSRERREQIPIPTELIRDVLPIGNYHLQEERRLFYVGMTRAKEKLVFTSSNFYSEGKRERKPSPFISEALGKKLITKETKKWNNDQIPLFDWSKSTNEIEFREKESHTKTYLDFLSYSSVETFKLCPLHFKLRYIIHIPTQPSAAQALGNSIHITLKDFYSHLLQNKQINSPESNRELILKILKTDWISLGYANKEHNKQAFEKAKIFLINYLNSELHKSAHPLFLEKPFYFKINGNLKILGKIDRIDDLGNGNIEIIDYKTGANVPTESMLAKDMQMTIYALAATDKGILGKDVSQVKTSFYYFDKNIKISTSRTLTQLEEAKKDLITIRSEIEKSDFNCSHNAICKNCEYKMLCNE